MALSNQAQMAGVRGTSGGRRETNRTAHARPETGVEPAAGRDPGKRNQPFVYSAAKATEEPILSNAAMRANGREVEEAAIITSQREVLWPGGPFLIIQVHF